MKKKNIFVICTVRSADNNYRERLESYVNKLERAGHKVHLPHRDTDQDASGYNICKQNATAIFNSDIVFLYYNKNSLGTHFDMGTAFALGKPIIVVENEDYGPGKGFARMADEWSAKKELI